MQLRQIGGLTALTAALCAGAAVHTSVLAADWEPRKPVEFVIMAGPGGGADKMARLMQSVIEKNDLASKPFVPVNKPGGSGAEALVHLKNKAGDDHLVMVTLNSFYTTPIRQPALGIDISTFTPIGRMAEDTFVLWVNKDSGITTLDEYVAAAKAAGRDWVMGGTGRAQEDELLTRWLNQTYGLDMSYVPFKGGGDVAKQLAGNHINSSVNNPSEALGFYEAGTLVPIASFTPERLELFPDTPTFKELGQDYSYFMQRSVVGPPGMSEEAAAYYSDLFAKLYETAEWQDYMASKSLRGDFMTDGELAAYWDQQRKLHEKLLKDIGDS
jgi:tripartite-type tricarboxylate transporter receptor subunit TctC